LDFVDGVQVWGNPAIAMISADTGLPASPAARGVRRLFAQMVKALAANE
jgi:hypothetical protein